MAPNAAFPPKTAELSPENPPIGAEGIKNPLQMLSGRVRPCPSQTGRIPCAGLAWPTWTGS